MPQREMPARAGDYAGRDGIAIGEQHRSDSAVGLDPHRIDGERVGPVDEIGDAAKAFRLALGAIGVARAVEARQRRVGLGIAERDGLEREGLRRHLGDGQRFLAEAIVVKPERLAVEREALQHETFAVENEWTVAWRSLWISPQAQLRLDPGCLRIEGEIELDRLDQIVRWSIVLEKLGLPGQLIHRFTTVLVLAALRGSASAKPRPTSG